MKVKELVEILSKFNQDLEVRENDRNGGLYDPFCQLVPLREHTYDYEKIIGKNDLYLEVNYLE